LPTFAVVYNSFVVTITYVKLVNYSDIDHTRLVCAGRSNGNVAR